MVSYRDKEKLSGVVFVAFFVQSIPVLHQQSLPSVNASITKFERLKYQKTISGCFSYTDEAFALLMVVNYEARWTSQYEAIAGYPAESRKIRAKRWKDAPVHLQY
jgi:hypothetical protein